MEEAKPDDTPVEHVVEPDVDAEHVVEPDVDEDDEDDAEAEKFVCTFCADFLSKEKTRFFSGCKCKEKSYPSCETCVIEYMASCNKYDIKCPFCRKLFVSIRIPSGEDVSIVENEEDTKAEEEERKQEDRELLQRFAERMVLNGFHNGPIYSENFHIRPRNRVLNSDEIFNILMSSLSERHEPDRARREPERERQVVNCPTCTYANDNRHGQIPQNCVMCGQPMVAFD